MKKRIPVFLLFFLCLNSTFAQLQTNFWYFGTLAGMDFTSGTPVVLTNGPINSNEGTASISDAAGNLLFYTDGVDVWNKNNALMPNGSGLFGDYSTTQMMIVPNPGDTDLFYIFTLDDEGGPNGLSYSVVDMSLQSGDGDVTTKNTFLRGDMTEKLAAVYHCNNHDIWLMAHDRFSNSFVAYLVTDAGINSPIISNVGTSHTDVHGQMKFSNDGHKIASAIGYQDLAEVLEFDNVTGVVSSPITLSLNHHAYGVEFSRDNTKLYLTHYDVASTSTLIQLDLNAGSTAAAIMASKITLDVETDPILYALQLGRDGKIYVTKEITPFLAVINNPNNAGTGCNYVDNAINLDPLGFGTMCMLGLPSFISSYFNYDFPNMDCDTSELNAGFFASDTIICMDECISFTDTSTGPPYYWMWSFQGATPSSDTAQNPTNICYITAGTYTVTLIIQDSTNTNIDTVTGTIVVVNGPVINAGADVIIQQGDSAFLNATGTSNYDWSPATGLSATNISNPIAKPTVTTTYYVTGTDTNGCQAIDSVTVSVLSDTLIDPEPPCEIFIPSAFSPNGDGHNDVFYVRGTCIEEMTLSLFNRWGEKVFETTDPDIGWDGIYKEKALDAAVFVYHCEITLTGGQQLSKKGNLSLVR